MGIDDESSHPALCSEVADGVTRNIVCLFREPDAGNPPVRFDEREQETEPSQTGLRRRRESFVSSHRETKATAPVLDSTHSGRPKTKTDTIRAFRLLLTVSGLFHSSVSKHHPGEVGTTRLSSSSSWTEQPKDSSTSEIVEPTRMPGCNTHRIQNRRRSGL